MNKIKELRKKARNGKMSQVDLATESGISIPTIKRLEKENFDFSKCKADTLEKLAKVFKVKVDYFLK